MFGLAKKIFGTKNARVIKSMRPIVDQIGQLEPTMQAKSDAELQAMTGEFRRRLEQGARLDDLLPEAFAVCREAGKRVLGMRHFDVQLIGGMVLHRGTIAEMKTGEGKTLVATLPVYLNALSGKGVHVVTVNDYLARRDAEWMGRIYKFLGMSVGIVVHGLTDAERQQSYRSDITYGTNNEFGFDYLRDNMKESIERYVQRDLNYAIVDEVDSILIDEARTPLIISGPAEESADLYQKVDAIIPGLRKDIDYTVDEKAHSAILTDNGIERVEQRLGVGNLYNPDNIEWLHHVTQALEGAHALQARRQLPGRRRQDHHRRRVHRPQDAGAPLVRRPAPGDRGQGGRRGPGREPDPRDHQLPELLPHLQEAGRHDRHRRHRGRGVPQDLQARRHRRADQPGDAARGRRRRRLQERAREVPRRLRRDRGLPQAGPAGAGRHRQRREVRGGRLAAAQEGHPPQRPERQAARARGVHRRPGRTQGRGHHLDQHGGPRDRHHPGRQRRVHGARRGRPGERRQARARAGARKAGGVRGGLRALQGPVRSREAGGAGRGRAAHPGHRAARVAAHRQPAARPRRPPGRSRAARASSCRSKTT